MTQPTGSAGASPDTGGVSEESRRRASREALYLEAHPLERFNVLTLATRAGLSRFHFIRAFRAARGTTPYQFQERLRAREACALLVAGAPPSEVAHAVG